MGGQHARSSVRGGRRAALLEGSGAAPGPAARRAWSSVDGVLGEMAARFHISLASASSGRACGPLVQITCSPLFHWRKPPTSDRARGRELRATRTSRPAARRRPRPGPHLVGSGASRRQHARAVVVVLVAPCSRSGGGRRVAVECVTALLRLELRTPEPRIFSRSPCRCSSRWAAADAPWLWLAADSAGMTEKLRDPRCAALTSTHAQYSGIFAPHPRERTCLGTDQMKASYARATPLRAHHGWLGSMQVPVLLGLAQRQRRRPRRSVSSRQARPARPIKRCVDCRSCLGSLALRASKRRRAAGFLSLLASGRPMAPSTAAAGGDATHPSSAARPRVEIRVVVASSKRIELHAQVAHGALPRRISGSASFTVSRAIGVNSGSRN